MEKTPILIVAAEASADLHAAEVVKRLRAADPALSFYGIGGAHLRAAGLDVLGNAEDLAVMGIWEVFTHLPRIKKAYDGLLRACDTRKPALALLLDYPGFNFRLMKQLHRRGIPVIYYICPQVWAWHPERVEILAQYANRRLVIFPFEEKFYKERGVEARYVGHPLLDVLPEPPAAPPSGPRRIGIFPGSRWSEIRRMLPVFMGALARVRQRIPDLEAVLFAAPTVEAGALRKWIPTNVEIRTVDTERHAAMRELHLAFMVSGTITLEAALLGVPGIAAYRLHPVTYALLKRRVEIAHISIVNILLGKRVFPEFIQEEATPDRLAAEALRLFGAPEELGRIRAEALALRAHLGHGAAANVVGEVKGLLTV